LIELPSILAAAMKTSIEDFPSIRPATLDDMPQLRSLIEASVRGLSVGYLTAEQIEREVRYVTAPDTQLIRDGTYFVAIHPSDGSIVAAGGWSRRRAMHGGDAFKLHAGPDADELLVPGRDPARIRAMFVHPNWTRRGLGRRLFETARSAAEADGFDSLVLTATMPGVPLYKALGFREERRYMDVLPDGSEIPVMEMTRPMIMPEHSPK
jgi:GNAT superfamily N-acetyltransferase